MGWLGSSRQTTTQTQTTTPTNPQWVTDAVQGAVTAGQNLFNTRTFTPYTGQMTAGLDPLQEQARTVAQTGAGGWRAPMDTASRLAMAGAQMQGRDVGVGGAPQIGAPAVARPVQQAPVTGATGTTAADNMGRYQNPFQSEVIDRALSAIRRTGDQSQAALGQRLAQSNAFGGSREAILRGQIEEGVMRSAGDTAAQLGREGFDAAARLGAEDAGRAQEANLFTAGARNTAAEAAAGRRQDTNLFNAGQRNQVATRQAELNQQGQQLDLTAQQSNQANDNTLATRLLAGANLFGDLGRLTGDQTRQDVGMLDTLGAAGRDVTQAGLDARRGEFDRENNQDVENYRLMLEGIYGAPFNLFNGGTTTGSGSTRSFSTSAALGDIGRIMSAGATLFSDARVKRDLAPVGVDEGGLTWWKYRYAWDPEGTERIGVLAQEAPAHAVRHGPNGMLMVDYAAL